MHELWSDYCSCCLPGAGFLLRAEGARLPDEERAGSFGDHPAEPAMDGQEPGLAAASPIAPSGLHSVQRRLHYLRTVFLFSLGRAQLQNGREGCALPCWTRCQMVWGWSCNLYLLAQGGPCFVSLTQEMQKKKSEKRKKKNTHSAHLTLSTKPLLRSSLIFSDHRSRQSCLMHTPPLFSLLCYISFKTVAFMSVST